MAAARARPPDRREYGVPGQRVAFVALQLLMFGVPGAYLWISGGLRSLRPTEPRRGPLRPAWQPVLGWAWLVVVTVFVATAGQGYYGAGIYPPLIAPGAVGLQAGLRRAPARVAVVVGVVALAAVPAPAALPLLPARSLQASGWSGAAENQFETVGWPRLVVDVAATYRALPPADRAGAVLLTANYGEAGAIDLYGPALGLPAAYSGHNAYGWWGPPPEGEGGVVAVAEDGPPPALPRCRMVAPVRNDEGVRDEESERAAIYVCAPPPAGWAAAWPSIRHLSS